jgi:hypothetical protein
LEGAVEYPLADGLDLIIKEGRLVKWHLPTVDCSSALDLPHHVAIVRISRVD